MMNNSTEPFVSDEKEPLFGLLIFAIISVCVIVVAAVLKFGCQNETNKRRVSPAQKASRRDIFQVSLYMSRLHLNLLDFRKEKDNITSLPNENLSNFKQKLIANVEEKKCHDGVDKSNISDERNMYQVLFSDQSVTNKDDKHEKYHDKHRNSCVLMEKNL